MGPPPGSSACEPLQDFAVAEGMKFDAIVVGAGMSGLAAGIRLAHFGKRVAIVEKHQLWGGLNSFYGQGGRRFDVGLHALTNYVPRGTKGAPLTRLLRALRLKHEELQLVPQRHSEILFPSCRLVFDNDFERLRENVATHFPADADGFGRLAAAVREESVRLDDGPPLLAREVLPEYIRDPLLIEMLLLPVLYYGSPREEDIEWDQFRILFQSIYLEGLARPIGGIRPLLNTLIRKLRSLGAELMLGNGVRRFHVENGAVRGVLLEDGRELESNCVLSSAGYVESMALVDPGQRVRIPAQERGQLSFLETLCVLDKPAHAFGYEAVATFFCTEERLSYRVPATAVDLRSGLISSPDNFLGSTSGDEGMLRATLLAKPSHWFDLEQAQYAEQKEACSTAAIDLAARLTVPGSAGSDSTRAAEGAPDWRRHILQRDSFTPRTIRHYTSRRNGAVYGSTKKRHDGRTDIEGLFLCGTDQGYLGVIGAMTSGILMANAHALNPSPQPA